MFPEPEDYLGTTTTPEKDTDMTYNLINTIMTALDNSGGITIHPLTCKQPTEGFVVRPYESREGTIGFRPGSYFINAFVQDNMDLLWAADHSLGIWYDEEKDHWVLDVVVVTRDRGTAVKLGMRNDQDAIWDVKAQEEIRLKHNGTPLVTEVDSPPAGLRY